MYLLRVLCALVLLIAVDYGNTEQSCKDKWPADLCKAQKKYGRCDLRKMISWRGLTVREFLKKQCYKSCGYC
ncbi:hypothetical protein GCK32_011385 [Trichostrongylus colubriformis]|uniref:ShKT domain-containing protein n=1 Tax=Trichostrongylus colubriformis TaxID=6319 RepID=A0AAN8IM77_TRICO